MDSGQFRALVVKFKLLEHMRLSKVDFWDRFGLSGRSIYTNKNDLLKYVEFDRCGAVVRSAFGKNWWLRGNCTKLIRRWGCRSTQYDLDEKRR